MFLDLEHPGNLWIKCGPTQTARIGETCHGFHGDHCDCLGYWWWSGQSGWRASPVGAVGECFAPLAPSSVVPAFSAEVKWWSNIYWLMIFRTDDSQWYIIHTWRELQCFNLRHHHLVETCCFKSSHTLITLHASTKLWQASTDKSFLPWKNQF